MKGVSSMSALLSPVTGTMAGTEKALSTYVLASMDQTHAFKLGLDGENTVSTRKPKASSATGFFVYTDLFPSIYLPSIHIALLQGDSQAQGMPHKARQGDRGRGNSSQPAEGEGLRLLRSQAWPRLSGLSEGKIHPTSFQLESGLQGSRVEGKGRAEGRRAAMDRTAPEPS